MNLLLNYGYPARIQINNNVSCGLILMISLLSSSINLWNMDYRFRTGSYTNYHFIIWQQQFQNSHLCWNLYSMYNCVPIFRKGLVCIPSSVSMFNNSFFILKQNQILAFYIYNSIHPRKKKMWENARTITNHRGPRNRPKTRNNLFIIFVMFFFSSNK